jgi:hypothetical protein
VICGGAAQVSRWERRAQATLLPPVPPPDPLSLFPLEPPLEDDELSEADEELDFDDSELPLDGVEVSPEGVDSFGLLDSLLLELPLFEPDRLSVL